jgi:hypothetical protein
MSVPPASSMDCRNVSSADARASESEAVNFAVL